VKLRLKLIAVIVGALATVGATQAMASPSPAHVHTPDNGCLIVPSLQLVICIPRM
jgi:hypothetical protein